MALTDESERLRSVYGVFERESDTRLQWYRKVRPADFSESVERWGRALHTDNILGEYRSHQKVCGGRIREGEILSRR